MDVIVGEGVGDREVVGAAGDGALKLQVAEGVSVRVGELEREGVGEGVF